MFSRPRLKNSPASGQTSARSSETQDSPKPMNHRLSSLQLPLLLEESFTSLVDTERNATNLHSDFARPVTQRYTFPSFRCTTSHRSSRESDAVVRYRLVHAKLPQLAIWQPGDGGTSPGGRSSPICCCARQNSRPTARQHCGKVSDKVQGLVQGLKLGACVSSGR